MYVAVILVQQHIFNLTSGNRVMSYTALNVVSFKVFGMSFKVEILSNDMLKNTYFKLVNYVKETIFLF